MIRVELALEPFDPAEELRSFAAKLGVECGAVVTFAGLARGLDGHGAPVQTLVLDHHPRLTERSLRDIAADGAGRFDVAAIAVVHRAGRIEPGEAIVWVAAASSHRRAAFEAADYLMDRLKTEAIFWKREEGPDGSRWIEPTTADHSDRARWE